MNWIERDTNWAQVAVGIRAKWAAVTDDDLGFLDRNKDALVGKIHERTGLARDTAERQIDALLSQLASADAREPVPAMAIRFPPAGP